MSERLNPPDVALFPRLGTSHVVELPKGMLLGRIHSQGGPYPTRWDEFRSFGPTGSRFDHHPPPPPRQHTDRSVLYAAPRLPGRGQVLRTCIAECFRDRGHIELSRDAPYFVLFRLAQPVRLLDLADSDWVSLAGGNAAISSGPRDMCRQWAASIWQQYGDGLDGLLYTCSNVPSERSAVLWERAVPAVPDKPAAHPPLTSSDLRADLEVIAEQLHLGVIP